MDYCNVNSVSYILICDYFSKFPYMIKAKTVMGLRESIYFVVEGHLDQTMDSHSTQGICQGFLQYWHQAHHFITL